MMFLEVQRLLADTLVITICIFESVLMNVRPAGLGL